MPIETICEGGFGGSAIVYIQRRNEFEGLGGLITTRRAVTAAYRHDHGGLTLEEVAAHSPSPEPTHGSPRSVGSTTMFLRHAIAKKLDDYFFRIGRYHHAHVPRPLGSTDEGYLYEWTFGKEGFPWEVIGDTYDREQVTLGEWRDAVGLFSDAGIALSYDVTDAEDGRISKNIVVGEQGIQPFATKISNLWKRIDYGSESLPIDYERLLNYITKHRSELIYNLNPDRVELMELAARFLSQGVNPSAFPAFERLSELAYAFRLSTLSHLSTQQTKMPEQFHGFDTKYLSPTKARSLHAAANSKVMHEDTNGRLDLDIRSAFPGIDGTIFTLQEIPVAHVHRKHAPQGTGFDLYLRHFLARKLEDLFIAQEKYFFAHIPRPVGSNANSYMYVWAHGDPRCPLELVVDAQPSGTLTDWKTFLTCFAQAGVDMQSGIEEVITPLYSYPLAKQIIIKQPQTRREPNYFSCMWKRTGFSAARTPIDLDALETYLRTSETDITKYLAHGRINTMMLTVRYLKGEQLPAAAVMNIILGIHDYRLSALRHINHYGFGIPPPGFVDLKVEYSSIIEEEIRRTLIRQGFIWDAAAKSFLGLSPGKYERERVLMMSRFLQSHPPLDESDHQSLQKIIDTILHGTSP